MPIKTTEPQDAAREARLIATAVDATEVHLDEESKNIYIIGGKKGTVLLSEPVVVRLTFEHFAQFFNVFLQRVLHLLGSSLRLH